MVETVDVDVGDWVVSVKDCVDGVKVVDQVEEEVVEVLSTINPHTSSPSSQDAERFETKTSNYEWAYPTIK